jgi:hypothetical protein
MFTLSKMVNISADRTSEIGVNQNLLYRERPMLEERDTNAQSTSFNSTLTWKITNIREKRSTKLVDISKTFYFLSLLVNVQLQRTKSIYSPPFYSSPTGYKMCLRLFLNGDNNARGTHMSVYLVIMRGDLDKSLHWPLSFKVTFTLLNQIQSNDNPSRSFWSDTRSICFQQPRSDMNIAYGFSKCFSLDILKQNENHFVRDDALVIKVEVDFLAKKSGKLSLLNNTLVLWF